ncbi:MAG: 6,7-dimethyl-8-ribityllumazine synthase [Alphaproteobacteria bacterium]|nr:6,7-dimethyl-8-ribityllumazine synthase [Alphaproteobacteria bacterium SS10]
MIEAPHLMIIEARYYEDVSDKLLAGATEAIERFGASYEVYTVPGALEIPSGIRYAVRSMDYFTARRRFDGYVALGCVIRGETSHYDVVCNESARGLYQLAMQYTLAIGNGILTVENEEQAIERADPARKNKGGEAANACIDLIKLKHQFRLYPR